MAALDLEDLLKPISEELPCGENLEYDPAFIALGSLVQGKGEQQFGNTVIPGEEPDWRAVRMAALDLLKRTADIRVGVHLARALVRTDGLPGFADALALIRGWLELRWDCVHPQLDPEEDNDPTMRVNAIVALCHHETVLRDLRAAPLVRSRTFGAFSLRDWLIATGEVAAPAGREAPQLSAIEGAFREAPVDALQATANAAASGIESVRAIETCVTDHVGASSAPDLSAIVQVLRDAQRILTDQLARRGVGAPAAPAQAADAAPATVAVPVSGEITSREDVIRLLDKACEYFERYEPSSPVPQILQRAKRLVSKNFLEILRDLAPDGVRQFELVSGVTSRDEE